ncbi:MAG: hypothetical protein AAF433_12335 [Bacteroidota bacterium]
MIKQLLIPGILSLGLLGCGSEGTVTAEESGTATPAEVQNQSM